MRKRGFRPTIAELMQLLAELELLAEIIVVGGASLRSEMILLRAYLLAGLLIHKAIWELLKWRSGTEPKPRRGVALKLIKAVKLGVLLGIVAQTLLPMDVLPIAGDSPLRRIAGAAIYTLGLLVAIVGRLQLGDNWFDIETPLVKGDHIVVSTGLYRYIRHPIYVGDLLLLLGLELALNSWFVLAVMALVPVVFRQAVREERMLVERLPGYDSYLRRTKRFIPFVV
jgi:protein-S-isoprenylcysteine O-methyltransferase Ste14